MVTKRGFPYVPSAWCGPLSRSCSWPAAVVRRPWTSSVVWSPDGRQAAVIGGDGLYLADGEGTLALLAADVYDAAWLADSERLVLARSREINNWSALADALGPQRTHQVAVKAEAVWQQIQAPGKPIALEDRLQALLETSLSQAEMGAILIHLRSPW